VLILRMKRCETALAGGRLDEAIDLLSQPDVRAHRRGQELMDQLSGALIERSRQHLAAGRFGPAGEDCRKAELLTGNTADIAELRAAIEHATTGQRARQLKQQQAAASARRLVEDGQLTLGYQLAARADHAGTMIADIDDRRLLLERYLAEAAAAFKRMDYEEAARQVSRAKSISPGSADVQALAKTISDDVAAEAERLVVSGQLSAAELMLGRLNPPCATQPAIERIRRGLDQCRLAWDQVGRGQHREAGELLARLLHLWPSADWLRTAASSLRHADGAIGEVRSGPLGLLNAHQTIAMPNGRPPLPLPPIISPPRTRGRRFLLHVDGAGSFLVLQGHSITVGPQSASSPPDVPLMTSTRALAITLSRSDEDYFLTASSPVSVNDKPVASKLLACGDRIAIGPRCRIQISRPNPASASAVLHVSGARVPWGGVRNVLLMDRELVIGPIASAHIKTRETGEQMVLQATDGQLLCRATGPIAIDGRPAGKIAELIPGVRVVSGSLSLVMQDV
jgi:tetratricopeptide (TPR) repeat protein